MFLKCYVYYDYITWEILFYHFFFFFMWICTMKILVPEHHPYMHYVGPCKLKFESRIPSYFKFESQIPACLRIESQNNNDSTFESHNPESNPFWIEIHPIWNPQFLVWIENPLHCSSCLTAWRVGINLGKLYENVKKQKT